MTTPTPLLCDYRGIEHLLLSARIDDSAGKLLESICATSRVNGDAIHSEGRHCQESVYETGKDILGSICSNTAAIQQGLLSHSLSIKDQVSAGDVALERNHGETRLLIAQLDANIRNTLQHDFAETRSLVNQTNMNVLLSAKDMQLELCKTQNVLERQASDNKASIELEALRNKEALSRELAECCCEIKQLVTQQSSDTRQLLSIQHCEIKEKIDRSDNLQREIEAAQVRDKLAQLQSENVFLRLKAQCCPVAAGAANGNGN